jgi:oxalate decarboxylase
VYFAKGKIPPAVSSPPLQGWKRPPLTHKYSLLSQKPYETFSGGVEWRVDGSQFPISTTMTGVVLEMEPGALRELHWHPNAAEWQYVLSGKFNVTMFGSGGRWREETLSQGDVGYIPQGFGHSIENVGAEKARILIVFNSGHYQTIDLSQWIAGNPVDILATNFSVDASVFEKFPRRDVFLTK